MSHGGARPRAGRPKGAATTTRKRRIAERAAKEGITPLEYMLAVMRESSDVRRRDEMAKAAAPYMHPKLAQVDVGNKDGQPLVVEVVRFSDG
jgi:hypothetical protein